MNTIGVSSQRRSVAAAAAFAATTTLLLASTAPTSAAPAPQNDAPKRATPFLSFYSGGLDGALRNPKDKWLLDTVRQLEANGVQLPPEPLKDFESSPHGRLIATVIRDLLTTRIAGSLALTTTQQGGPPMPEGQLSFMGSARRPGASLEPVLADALKAMGLWSEFRPDAARPGMRTYAPRGAPPTWFGTIDMAGGSATVVSVGRPPIDEAPTFERFGLPAGTEPISSFELDFGPLQPYLGMAAAMLPPGPDGRTFIEQIGLISDTPPIFRMAQVNDGNEMRVLARLVNGASAMKMDAAMRAVKLDAEDLRWIPADACSAWIGKADLPQSINALIDQYNAQAALLDDEGDFDDDMGGGNMNDGAGDPDPIGAGRGPADAWVSEHLGVDLRRDLVAPLGDFVAYQTSASLGGGFFGSVGVIGLRDSAAMKSTLDRLGARLAGIGDAAKVGLALRPRTHPGCDALYSLSFGGLPIPIQLVVGIGHDALVVGLTPQSVIAAIAQATAKTSLLDNAGMKALGGADAFHGAASLWWVDAPRNIRDGYGVLLALATAADSVTLPQGAAATPVTTVVPSIDELIRGAKPSLLVGGVDGDDFYWILRCDGSASVQIASLAGWLAGVGNTYTAMALGVMLPALAKAREQARMVRARQAAHEEDAPARGSDVHTQVQLRKIGMGVQIYAADHQDRIPEQLKVLLDEGIIEEADVENPRHEDGLTGGYGYRRPGPRGSRVADPPTAIVAWEEFEFFPRGGVWAVFLDGHVRRITDEKEFRALIGE